MRFISCHDGKLHALDEPMREIARDRRFTLGLPLLDELLPAGLAKGAVHEVLMRPEHGSAKFFALLLAKQAAGNGAIAWCDPAAELYPPAIAAAGIALDRLYLLQPQSEIDQHWALAECLRCKGVAAAIASPKRLSHVEARRLQLAAESGGSVGVLIRPWDRHASIYAAATRWLIEPARGEQTVQRWKVELIRGGQALHHGGQAFHHGEQALHHGGNVLHHGHGGRIGGQALHAGEAAVHVEEPALHGNCVYLECSRETNHVRAVAELAAGSGAAARFEAAG
jgi:protein ImuA